jgi:ferric-dicitrate binding protein FerR (iron transport regulator)
MENLNKHIDINLLTRFLADEITPEEKELLLQWKKASVDNEKQFDELQKIWQAMDKTTSKHDIDIDTEWRHLQVTLDQTMHRQVKTIPLSFLVRVAAAVLIAFGLFYFGWNFLTVKTVKTKITETNEIVLPDGSRVTINADSKLTYKRDFGKESRILNLQGEAFFEVQKNPDRPFIIQAGNAEIKVLGTSFNVKAYKEMNKIEVTVAEGVVSLYEKDMKQKKVLAGKGEKAVYNKQQKIVKKQANDDRNYISWKTQLIVFENDSLLNIAETLSDVYHKDIIILDPSLNNCTVTTKFENKDLETVIKVLESTLDIRLEEKEGKIFISGKGC